MVKTALFLMLLCACEPSHVVDRTKVPSSTAVSTRVSVRCVPVGGAHARVWRHDEVLIEGELLDASARGLTLLVADQNKVEIAARDIERVEIDRYSNGLFVGLLTLWGVVGTISTLSHGGYLVLSAPSWALLSTLAITPVGTDPDRLVSTSDLTRLHEYARFPGGIPDSFDVARAHIVVAPACD